jgi:hypothetical protein
MDILNAEQKFQIMNERKRKCGNADGGRSMGNYRAVKKSLGYRFD